MKTLSGLMFLLALFFASASAQDYSNRNMVIRFNYDQNIHPKEYQVHDFLSDSLNRIYRTKRTNILSQWKSVIDSELGVNSTGSFPENISSITFSDAGSGKGQAEILLNNCTSNFEKEGCTWNISVWIKFTVTFQVITEGSSYILKVLSVVPSGQITDVKADNTKWYRFWGYITCSTFEAGGKLIAGIYNWQFATAFRTSIADLTLPILTPNSLAVLNGVTDTSVVGEAIRSFPMKFSFGGTPSGDLILGIDMMQGTTSNPTAFTGITPSSVTDPTFEHIGFNLSRGSLYDAFSTYDADKRPFTTTGETGNAAQISFIIQSMKNYLGRTVSFYFHWSDIAQDASHSTLLVNGTFDPATLTPGPGGPLETKIAELYANGQWKKSTDILDSLHNNGFDAVATVERSVSDAPHRQ